MKRRLPIIVVGFTLLSIGASWAADPNAPDPIGRIGIQPSPLTSGGCKDGDNECIDALDDCRKRAKRSGLKVELCKVKEESPTKYYEDGEWKTKRNFSCIC